MVELLPEWHRQWGVMLAWPHADTDWANQLSRAEPVFCRIAMEVLERERLLLLCRDESHEAEIRSRLRETGACLDRLDTVRLDYNDTWTRDYGPITVLRDGQPVLLDFQFNGWGNKYDHGDDNEVTSRLDWRAAVEQVSLVLEGGAFDTDGQGNLVTTSRCLLHPSRNPHLDREELEERLRQYLGVRQILWLESGELEGDDTDGHIDMLARFCSRKTLAYMQCTDRNDSHYSSLVAMEQELQELAINNGLELIALPLPPPIHAADGHRLPASYANFLIINGAVLVPVYGVETDEPALRRLESAFPDRDVIPVHCRPLIEQHGSLHCVTMQLPSGVR